jgi:hypothetical protein
MTLSGNLMRQATHYERHTSVAGVSDAHSVQSPGRGIFEPTPETATPPAPGNVWSPFDPTPHTELYGAGLPTGNHGASSMAPPIPSGVDQERGDNTATARMVHAHSGLMYDANQYAPYHAATQRRSIEWVDGRRPQDPSMDAFLVGPNGYDRSNPTSDVYGGDRYRVGTWTPMFGHYEFWQKQGQDAWIRPVAYEVPILPVDKPNVANPAPYTTPSSGTQRFVLPSFQDPRMFVTPSETGMSDFTMTQQSPVGAYGFADDGRL